MSAENQKLFEIGDDAEIESLLTPRMGREREIINGGNIELQKRKAKISGLLRKKIIPGLEARREDLGNFCVTFKNQNEKLLVFVEPFDGYNKYLGVGENDIFEIRASQEFGELLRIPGKYLVDRVKKNINDTKWEINYLGGQDISLWERGYNRLSIEKADFSRALGLITARIKTLEEEVSLLSREYETGEHPRIVDMQDRLQRLQDLSAMLPEPLSKISRLQNFFHGLKRKPKP